MHPFVGGDWEEACPTWLHGWIGVAESARSRPPSRGGVRHCMEGAEGVEVAPWIEQLRATSVVAEARGPTGRGAAKGRQMTYKHACARARMATAQRGKWSAVGLFSDGSKRCMGAFPGRLFGRRRRVRVVWCMRLEIVLYLCSGLPRWPACLRLPSCGVPSAVRSSARVLVSARPDGMRAGWVGECG